MTGFKRHRRSGASVATFTAFEADLLLGPWPGS